MKIGQIIIIADGTRVYLRDPKNYAWKFLEMNKLSNMKGHRINLHKSKVNQQQAYQERDHGHSQ